MTDRRNFLKTTAAAAAVVLFGTRKQAGAADCEQFSGIVYTADNPGMWEKKVGSHAPVVAVENGNVTVTTRHGMSEVHFIVRHTLVLADGTVVGTKNFTPTDEAQSTYVLPDGYKGNIYATSFCNLHDFWLTKTAV
jgi:superoxide reductase